VLNDPAAQKVFHASENGTISEFAYASKRASIVDFKESDNALINKESATDSTCDSTGTTSCYKGKKWTLIGETINKTNLTIIADGIDVTASTNLQNLDGNTIFTFSKDYLFDTLGETRLSPVPNSTISIIQIGDIASGGEDYDYRYLGETWSSPRVVRIPNQGRGDKDILDDEYVAVMSGGYGYPYPKIGSNAFIIDWLTGKIKKRIDIEDVPNDIINSLPSTPVVINARNSGEAEYSGALVYLADLEGKITKINLTNMEFNYEYDETNNSLKPKPSFLDLYDQTTLINLEASRLFNNRFMYHSLEAGIGARYNKLWLYGGTGDFLNLNDVMVNPSSVDNLMFGIKDVHFPYFGQVNDAATADKLTNCKDTTSDSTAANCPENADLGWYIKLTDQKKVVAEPTLSDNIVYYPIYKPTSKNNLSCGSGDAYICAADAECGTNISNRFPGNPNNHKGEECYFVGTGVLSKLVIHGSKIYANITEQSQNPNKDDLVVIESLSSGVENFRNSWRENF
jgi:type IV pilus assembly protein PilY1